MKISFRKMNGAGNDFVLINNLDGTIRLGAETIAVICDRRRGVGADGLILLERDPDCDAFMRFHNSDGGEEVMCGNGSRCAVAFAAAVGQGNAAPEGRRIRLRTGSGVVDGVVSGERVRAGMMDATEMARNLPVAVAQVPGTIHFMVVGTRHVVVQMDDVEALSDRDIVSLGRALRHDPAFAPRGANVNFSSVDAQGNIHLRTYEKGVEAETYACGTGSISAAVLYGHDGAATERHVIQRSGDVLTISFELNPKGADHVVMEGPAVTNFDGTIDV